MCRAIPFIAALLAACALVGTGCGDDDGGGSGAGEGGGGLYGGGGGGEAENGEATGGEAENGEAGGGEAATELRLSADPGGALAFDKTSLSAGPGDVTIVMDNPSDIPHAISISGAGVDESGETVGKGGVSEVTADLDAGEYRLYCPVGDHAEAGMTGTLKVD
jgi:plastocyanin